MRGALASQRSRLACMVWRRRPFGCASSAPKRGSPRRRRARSSTHPAEQLPVGPQDAIRGPVSAGDADLALVDDDAPALRSLAPSELEEHRAAGLLEHRHVADLAELLEELALLVRHVSTLIRAER